MILQQKLDQLTAQFSHQIPDQALVKMKQANNNLAAELGSRNVPKIGEQLPAFSLQNQDGKTVTLQALLKDGPLIISFFRGVWCPYCNIEVKALQEYAQRFRDEGANIVVISPQAQASALKTVAENRLSFDVLSDVGNRYANALDIAFTLPADIKQLYSNFGINLPQHNDDDSWSLPMPARIVVEQSGKVMAIDVNPDYTQRPDPNETLAVLKQAIAA